MDKGRQVKLVKCKRHCRLIAGDGEKKLGDRSFRSRICHRRCSIMIMLDARDTGQPEAPVIMTTGDHTRANMIARLLKFPFPDKQVNNYILLNVTAPTTANNNDQ